MGRRSTTVQHGIYRIDGPNGRFYVGSALRLSRRWIEHRRDLRRGDHANPILQCAWNHHGEHAFAFSVLEYVSDPLTLIAREQFWIDRLGAVTNGYNVLPTAGSHLGRTHSQETRRKMSVAHSGRKRGPLSDERKAYLSSLYKGRALSPETRKRMSEARKGVVFSKERNAKISAALTGRRQSDETRQKIARANIGRKHAAETRAAMSASHRNRLAANAAQET